MITAMIAALLNPHINSDDVDNIEGKLVSTEVEIVDDLDPIRSIYVWDDGKNYHVCGGGSDKMERVSPNLFRYTFKNLTPNGNYRFHFCINNDLAQRYRHWLSALTVCEENPFFD